MLFTIVKSVALFERSSYPDSPAGCTAVSARSRDAFTDVSSFDSSILHATMEADNALAVIVRSISAVSDTVSIVFTSAPVSMPASFVSSAAVNHILEAVSSISSASRTTTPVCQFTESTAPPPVAETIGLAGSVESTEIPVHATIVSTIPEPPPPVPYSIPVSVAFTFKNFPAAPTYVHLPTVHTTAHCQ